MRDLEKRLRWLLDTVDGASAPRFDSWDDLLAFATRAALIGAGVERDECADLAMDHQETYADRGMTDEAEIAADIASAVRARSAGRMDLETAKIALTDLGFQATVDSIDAGDIASRGDAHKDLDWHWGHADRDAESTEAFNAARAVIDAIDWKG